MKKLFFFGMIGAMALSFNACSSDEDALAVNPTFDGSAVKTQFAFNVGQGQFATRMTDANVQAGANPSFLGLDDMTLFAFTGTPADASATTTKFELGSIGKTITLDNTNKFYTLQIPVGTDNFVFYGHAPSGDNDAKGELINNVASATTLGGIEFTLKKRASDDLFTGETATGIIAKLNAIAAAKATITIDGQDTEKTWAASTDATLKALYTNFTDAVAPTDQATGKIRAGYDAAIQRVIDDLEAAAAQLKTSGLNDEVKAIATAIETACKDYTVPTFPGADMPKGAAQLEWTGTAFQFKAAPDVFKAATADPQKIAYPAELFYWDNSPLRATDLEKKETDYPNGLVGATGVTSPWFPDASWTSDWVTGAVKATTRAIAMKENVNYGVAGLHTTLGWASTNYADNTKALVEGATEDKVFVVDQNSFTLTGILVGGQPSKANWQMLPAAGTADAPTKFDWVVYDNKLNATNEIYTLLLDNYESTVKPVRVALEFTNNLKETVTNTDGTTSQVPADFYGVDGIIPAGGTFYLVAELTVPTGAAWSANYENTRIQNAIRIFAQDRMTEANFKFSANALKNAYETIPDLQSVSMLFGLSVDIKWLPGLTFSEIEL
ncbi:MAG: hypothetical protein J6W19_06480 [Prevotella sp.]|nr:hypothetical protein [Prevotella sp.]